MGKNITISDELIGRYFSGKVSDKDIVEIEEWLNNSKENQQYFKELADIWNAINAVNTAEKINIKKALKRFEIKRSGQYELYKSKNPMYYFIRIAASLLLIIGLALGGKYVFEIYSGKRISKKENIVGLNKAVIILADGSQIFLKEDAQKLGFNETENEIHIDGEIIITGGLAGVNQFNTIIIPKGKRITLFLSDGSEIILNSASKLSIPVNFSIENRYIELEGEAYFDIKNNQKSNFTIKALDIHIEVLGTSFNVSSYSDDDFIETTLVEGSLKVFSEEKKNSETIILIPNQKALFLKNRNKIVVNKVDVELYTSWKDGYFKFDQETFDNITKKLSRAYNVEFVIENPTIRSEMFSGKLFRQDSIESLLDIIQVSTYFRYNKEGKTITIKSI